MSLKKEFKCYWEHPRFFSVIKMKNMKHLFNYLGIEVIHIEEVVKKRRVTVIFTLKGTEEQHIKLNEYMGEIRKVS